MTQHTPEPWAVNHFKGGIIGVGSGVIVAPPMSIPSKYNASRIVACVNQCAGFTSDKLESGDLVLVPRDEFHGLIRQRDELKAKAGDKT